jgi:nitroreductase
MSTFDEVLRRRRMVRHFTDEPVDRELLVRVLGAVDRAPSAGNSQGVDLVVLEGPATERYWSVTFADPEARARFRWQGLLRAPVLAVVVTDPQAYVERYAEADKAATGLGAGTEAWAVPYWWVDAGMAVENVLLAATSAGLGACFFGLFRHEAAVLDALGVPAGRRGVGTLALGHPAPGPSGRSAARGRRPKLHWTAWSR